MADALSLETYVVQRSFRLGGLHLSFSDADGNQVLESKGRLLVTQQPLQTMDGKVVRTVTHKIIAATPEYDVHVGGPKGGISCVIKVPMQLMGTVGTLSSIEIRDGNGNVLATASGSFMNWEFDIRAPNGDAIATVTRKTDSPGLMGKLSQMAHNQYAMSITGKGLPVEDLLGFLIVIELLLAGNKGSNPALGRGFGLPQGGGIQF